jgi:hypothetical protein
LKGEGEEARVLVALARFGSGYDRRQDYCVIARDGAARRVGEEGHGRIHIDRPIPAFGDFDAMPGRGLWVWEGTVGASLSGLKWDGSWRRATAQEAILVALGRDPFAETLGSLIDERLSGLALESGSTVPNGTATGLVRSLHRVLYLTINAELNAVEAGLKTAPEAFLPYLVGPDGLTLADAALPRLRLLNEQGGATRLLEG